MFLPFSTLLLTMLLGTGVDGTRAVHERTELRRSPSAFATPAEPPAVEIQVGDPAPNFSYQGFDGRWMRLHHLLDQGPVLLIFDPGQDILSRLEEEREALLDLGVVPVAVVDSKPGAARTLAQRMGLRYTVLSDQRLVIASQFNSVQSTALVPSWFVVDHHGRVRGMGRGRLPSAEYPRICARALSLPMPGAVMPSVGGHGGFRRYRR